MNNENQEKNNQENPEEMSDFEAGQEDGIEWCSADLDINDHEANERKEPPFNYEGVGGGNTPDDPVYVDEVRYVKLDLPWKDIKEVMKIRANDYVESGFVDDYVMNTNYITFYFEGERCLREIFIAKDDPNSMYLEQIVRLKA